MQQMIDEAGNIWNVDDQGNTTFVGNANQQRGMQIKPPDPTRQYDAPTAAANLEGANLTNEERKQRLLDARRGELKPGFRWSADGMTAEPIPGIPVEKSATEIAADQKQAGEQKRAATIQSIMGQVRQLYGQNIKGGWPNAISGRVPALLRPEGEEFNAAANAMLPLIRPLVAQSAKEGDSDKEMEVFMAYIPRASDSDQTIERKLGMLETLINGMTGGTAPSQVVKNIDEGRTPDPLASDRLGGYVSSDQGPTFGPNGPIDGPPPSGGVPGASQRDTTMGAIDAFGRRFANAPTLGMADKFAAGMNALVPLDNLFGANNRSVWDGSSLNDAYNANLALQQRTGAADQQVNPYASTAGDVAGSIVGMMGANAGLKALGAGGLVARTGGAAGDVLYGATRGGVENGPTGALVGGGAALGGNLAGKYLLAPVARRIADTGVGQAAINTARRGTNALGNAGRGLFGKAPVPYAPATIPAALSGGERAAAARIPEDVQAQLGQAEQMGIPMGLVDTSPQLQSLGGSVARKSPDALAMARQTLGQRALGQADRAQQQIAQNFGPIANPNEISSQLLQQARANSAPLYDAFRAQPARTSDELQAILQTPAGNQALRNARSIAANEGRDPNALGFDLDQQGNVVLRADPSPETLDLVKRGLDDVISGYKNPMTGQLDLNDQGRAIEGLRQRFVSEADRLYPNYADARAAYAGPAAERQALQMGRDMTNKAPRDIQDAMGRMTPGQVEQFRLGQRVGMSDAVDKVRYSSNPYQNIYGSPVAQQRAATVFGEGPAQRMRDAYDLEQRMAQTGYDVLGGSPTAMRAAADEAFDNPMATGIDVGFSALTGGGGAKELGAKLVQKLGDTYRLGASKKRADQLAPILFNTNPAEARKIIEALSKKSAARDVYVKRTRKAGGLFGAGVGSALIPLSQ